MYKTYLGTTNYADTSTESAIDCMDYMYEIDNTEYDGNLLSFRLNNRKISDVIKNIIIKSDDNTETVELELQPGESENINLNISLNKDFLVFIPGCEIYKKTISIN